MGKPQPFNTELNKCRIRLKVFVVFNPNGATHSRDGGILFFNRNGDGEDAVIKSMNLAGYVLCKCFQQFRWDFHPLFYDLVNSCVIDGLFQGVDTVIAVKRDINIYFKAIAQRFFFIMYAMMGKEREVFKLNGDHWTIKHEELRIP